MGKFDFTEFNTLFWPILLAILILLVVLVIIIVAKTSSANRRKTELLSNINASVSELNQKLGQAAAESGDIVEPSVPASGSEQLEVVFIDNRVEGSCFAEQEIHPLSEERSFVRVSSGASRFTDRNCGTDKNGRSYTEEELIKQIRE